MFPSPWRIWLRRLSRSIQFGGQWRPRRFTAPRLFRPRLERLEDRVVPTVTTLTNYNGVNFGQSALIQANTVGGGATPPDPQGAAGPNSYIEEVNLTIALFGPKTSGVNPVTDAIDDFFNYQGNLPDPNPSDVTGNAFTDPSVVFDDQTQRFIVSCMEVDPSSQFGSGYTGNNSSVYDFAVSKSSNPLTLTSADWNFYQIKTTEPNEFSDFPGNLGYNDGALVVTLNEINPSSPNQSTDHVLVTAINMSDLTNGVPQANLHYYQTDFQGNSLRPTTMHDSTSVNDPMWFVQEHPGTNDLGDGQHIDVVRMNNVLSSTPTFTTTTLAVKPYTDVSLTPPKQADGSVVTPDLDSRILKVAERNGLLVATHSVSVSSTQDDAQWYVINVSSGTPTLQQQGDVSGGNNTYITYPGIDINSAGDIGMSYMQSGTDTPNDWLSMYVTGRTPTDPSGTMETPVLVQAGQQVYQDFGPASGTDQRAGDLSGINVDAQGNFWTVNEFADSEPLPTKSTPSADWGTNITSFTFAPVADLNVTASGPATVTPGGTATYTITLTNNGPNAAQNVVLSDILPAGATNASIKPTSNPDGFSFTLTDGVYTSNSVTVANGDKDVFTLTVSVPSSLASGVIFDDTASVTSSTTDPNPYDDAATVIGSTGQSITISTNYNAASYGSSATILGGVGSSPPDNEGAVGPNSFVEAVNDEIAIFTPRTSGANPIADSLDNFFAVTGNLPDPNPKDSFGNFITDPFVIFDEQTQRFIAGCIEVDPGPQFDAQSTGDNSSVLDLAVSKSSNPASLKTTDWNFYQIRTTEPNSVLSDYPGNAGYNGGALVVTLNEMSPITQNPDHVLVNAINMSDLTSGVPQASLRFYQTDFKGMSLRPTTMHDSKSASDPMWFVQEHLGANGQPDNQHIDVVRMNNVLSSTPTFTTTTLAVNPYSQIVAPLQPDGSMVTDYLDSRIMKVAEQGGTLVAAHSVSNAAGNQDLIQWYQISVSGGTPVLQQQGDLGAGPNTYLYFPGIDINPAGDIGMSYMQSGADNPNDFLSMYVTGRTPTDPSGTMKAPVLAQAGQQVYEDYAPAYASPQRAGDLSGINVDSAGNFWAINEFADGEALPTSPGDAVADPSSPAADWGTDVVSFSLPPTAPPQAPSPYVVTKTADDGSTGTLRDAINQVNAGKYNEIDFKIAGTGVQTINLTSQLPTLTASGVFINGLSQGGSGNTQQLIELNGSGTGSTIDGLLVQGSNDIISGLIIEHFNNGIEISGANNTIGGTATGAGNVISGNNNDGVLLDSTANSNQFQGNYIGTNVAGTAALANKVGIEDAGSSDVIGGGVVGDRNLISGNTGDGILLDSTATADTVEGNFIGLNFAANTALANGGNGIEIKGVDNVIGGDSGSNFHVRNYVSGNSKDGVLIDSGATGNQVLGNFIGVDISGTHGVANLNGVEIAGNSNTIGGTVSGYTNVLSGNTNDGLLIDSTASANLIHGNDVGTDYTGQKALANSIGIEVAGNGNTIGGTVTGARNLLSGNSSDGVKIDAGASGTLIQGNYLGLNYSAAALANGGNGINIAGNNNTVGGTASGARNILSANSKDGVLLASTSSGNQVLGNYIGTNLLGTATLANSIGVEIAGTSNTVGGTASGARNILAGNSNDGVKIDSGASSNQVLGNYIGLNVNGAALGNSNGVEIAGAGNSVGGTAAAARNIVSGNSNDGVLLDSTASSNQVLGDYIGSNAAGSGAVANKVGIEDGGSGNTLGGSVAGARNVISGNSGDGVLLDSGGSGNQVLGNFVGLNFSGTAALANSGNGIEIQGASNTVGGPVYNARNFIAGNSKDGILLGSSSSGNLVLDSFIGLNLSGTVGVANLNGVEIAGSNNTLGSTVSGGINYISGNSNDGVLIDSTAKGNLLISNDVGTDYTGQKAVANSIGIEVAGAGNTLGGTVSAARNLVAGNSSDGVKLDSTASGTLVIGNSIGVNAADAALGNGGNGLNILSTANTIGGTVSGSRNVLSGNHKDGLLIASGASGNQVLGNYIGTNIFGTAALSNSSNGIEIAGNGNTIGGTAWQARNVISGNTGDGMKIDSGVSGIQVQGNYIGLNSVGTGGIGNSGNGIEDAGSGNILGGSVSGARNVVSGNSGDGILLDSTATGEAIQGNFLGLNSNANAALANSGNGLEVQGTNNTIGGSFYLARNYLSGNSKDGLLLGSSSSGNLVLDNFIGVDISGTHGVANLNGVEIAGNSNTIGGTVSGYTNVLSGNTNDGLLIDSTASANLIHGNDVGTDYTGQKALANSIGIEVAGNGNTIGGTVTGARNLLSGNSSDGVKIDAGASGTLIQGNYLGLNYSAAALANGGNGINIAGNNNTVGGTASGARNILSANSKDGVLLASTSSGNQVLGNYIGTNLLGTATLANSIGVEIAGTSNTVGGTASGARNILAGNSNDGVKIDSGASSNQVLGNYIGLNVNGAALGNSNGVEIAGAGNSVGGTAAAARNIVSGNSNDGVLLDSTASSNQVLGDYIGSNAAGSGAVANKVGIEDGGSGNTLGGSVAGARNVISGNSGDGVLLDSGGSGNQVLGNFVGLNFSANAALANGGNGIEIQGSKNSVGGSVLAARNYISGNSKDGVLIANGATGNQVLGNFIGLDISGTHGISNLNGVEVAGSNNTLGGTVSGTRNIISGNSNDGVLIDSTAASNVIQGNDVGTDYTGLNILANSGNGVEIAGNNNMVGGSVSGAGNVIANNSKDGVLVSAGSGNTIRRNSIYNNAGPGISLSSGANNNITPPKLNSAAHSVNTLTVTGSFNAPTANVSYVLEFFANPSNDVEGKYYLGSLTVTPTSTGTQNFTFSTTNSVTTTNPLITATLTDNLGDTSAFSSILSATAMLSYHNDITSTGQNLTETTLTPSNVNSTTFGKLFATSVDGQIYAQPLYDPGVNITTGTNPGTYNVVFVATEHDSLYAINANTGAILWHDALLHAVHGGTVTSIPNGDVNSSDINPEIGITATPIIDPNTNILYVEAKTKEVATDGNHYIHQLYAINISNGSYVNGSPVVVADSIGDTYVSGPTVNGTGDGSSNGVVYFDALRQHDRPGLTIANGNVYLAFASHGDNGPYHGWVLSYNLSTLTLNGVLNTTPNGGLGGIWMGGDRLPVDAQGNLYFETGNGTFDTTLNSSGMPTNGDYGDSFVKIAVDPTTSQTNQNINGWGLKVVDYFTPFDQATLNNNDWDLGSGGPILLPDSVGSTAHPHLLVGSGKEGRIYLIDQDNMGHYNSSTDNVVEETNNTTITGSFGDPAYYNGQIYYFGGSNIGNPNDVGKTFSIANGQLSLTPTAQGPDTFSYPGDTPSISANGNINGIVWATDTGSNQLRAYNAAISNSTLSELYTSGQAASNRDALTGTIDKFAVPTVADGQVFVGSSDAVNVYGILQAATQAPAAPSNLTATTLSGASIELTWQDNSTYPNKASGFDIEQSTDGVHFTQVATASAGTTSYTVGGLQTSTAYTFRIRAFNNIGNSAYSNTASATTSSTAPNLNFSTGFANSSSLLTFNSSAKVNGTNLELTDGNGNEAGSAFSTSEVDITKFNTQFSFQLSGGSNTADGFTFCIQTAGNTALGSTGGGLGYQGIATSVAIKFDLYNNSGEGNDSTGIYTDGAAPTTPSIDLSSTGINLHSGDVINVTMSYDGTTLTVKESDPTVNATATQSYTINIPTTVGTGTAYVGFTGGTGGLTAVQNILNWTFTSGTPSQAPIAPVNSTAAAVSATEANVTWTNYATNQTGFHIDRATDPNFTQNLVTMTAAANATSYVDPGLSVGATYYYRVRAFNAFGDSPNSNTTSAVLPTLPAAVSNLTVTNATTSEIDLSWTNNATNADSIEVFRQLGENNPILIASLSPTTTSLADTGLVVKLKPGTAYFYSVHAMNAAGPSLIDSVTGTTASSTPAPQLPNGGTNKPGNAVPTGKVNTVNPSTTFPSQLSNRNVGGSTFTAPGVNPTALSPAGGGLDINGAVPANAGSIDLSGSGSNPHSGDTFSVRMTYNGTSFMVKTTDTNMEESTTDDTLNWTYSTTT